MRHANEFDSIQSDLARFEDDGGFIPDDQGVPAAVVRSGDTTETPPALNLTPGTTERRAHEAFARHFSAPEYRERFNRLYPLWRYYNATYFDGQLEVPHISIGRTSPRRFSECRETTDHGAQINIVLTDRVLFGTDRRVVRAEYPAEGFLRFTDDLLLAETVKQYVLEVFGTDEDGYGGYGPRYADEATRIGAALGLPRVEARRRGLRGRGLPVAAFWPWAFRPSGYYLGHIRLDHLRVAGLRTAPPSRCGDAIPGVYEYFLHLLVTNQIARLTEILGRQVDATTEARSPATAATERTPLDASGMILSIPVLDPAWLTWNAGCVRAIAEGIRTRRAFDGMPILADALQDAGCDNSVVLNHCREHTEHTANCWALRLLTEPRQT